MIDIETLRVIAKAHRDAVNEIWKPNLWGEALSFADILDREIEQEEKRRADNGR